MLAYFQPVFTAFGRNGLRLAGGSMLEGLNLPCGVRVLRHMCLVPSLLSLDLLGSVLCL